jgi:hypothetical protein
VAGLAVVVVLSTDTVAMIDECLSLSWSGLARWWNTSSARSYACNAIDNTLSSVTLVT